MEAREPGFNAGRGYTYPEYEESAVLRWGKAFEDAVIKLSEEVTSCSIYDREKLYKHSEYDYITCHIDGEYGFEQHVLHEGKTAGFFYYKDNFGKPGTDRVPPQYGIQGQQQMACTGADEVILSVLVFPKSVEDWEKEGWHVNDNGAGYLLSNINISIDNIITPLDWARPLQQMGYFHQYTIKRNQELIDSMIKKYVQFWTDYVLTGKEPEPQNYDDLMRMLPSPKGTIIASDQVERWCYEYKQCGDELGVNGNLQKRREQLKVLILNWMRKQDSVMDDETREKTILKNTRGHNLIGYNGKVFR